MDMEQLFSDNRLGELEEKIDLLLSTYKGMREEKEGNVRRIESLEAENTGAEGTGGEG